MIRPMTVSDLLAVESLQGHLRHADPELLDAVIRGPFCGYVALDGSIVGYAVALPGHPATLSELVVDPAYQRRGYGRALVEHVSDAIGSSGVEVTTPVENAASRRFYAAIGFEFDGRARGFYADGADALRLVRRE